MNKSNLISFHYLMEGFSFRNRTKLKDFIGRILKEEKKSVEQINYIFCSDEYLLKVNNDYLGHNYLTDIITFELSENGAPLIADIFISIERVKENAQAHETTFQEELHRVIFHGILHLLDYNDKSPLQQKKIRKKENELLEAYL